MWLAIIILVTWVAMALTSPTKEIRNRRLGVIGVVILLGLFIRLLR